MKRSCLFRFLTLIFTAGAAAQVMAAEPKQYAGESLNKSPDITIIQPRNIDTPPKFLRGTAPVYPIRQMQLANSGRALIEFTITASGDARDFHVVSASYKSFADHAILAVQNWKWQPALRQRRPVAVRVRLPFTYLTRSYGNTGNQVPY
jgi:TonB family protein